MTQNENQKENEFKLKILRQLKDPDSALNTFLSKLDPEDTDYRMRRKTPCFSYGDIRRFFIFE